VCKVEFVISRPLLVEFGRVLEVKLGCAGRREAGERASAVR